MNASSIDEVKQDLEKTLLLMREARFGELAAHAEQMSRHAAALEQLKADIEAARSNWPVYASGIYLVNASIVTIGNLVLPTLMLVTSVRELQT